MPVLQTKIEGKGNGIKTVLPNVSDVARALSRPPTYPTKFFGIELGAQTSTDEKNDRYIVNGAHNADRLRELLHGFIDKFVLCGDCKNPETDLLILKNKEARTEVIIRDCKACGAQTSVDMRHKLTTFILKNPPKTSKKSKSGRKGSDGPAGDGAHATSNGSPVDDEGSGSGTDDELSKRIKAEAAELTPESTSKDDDWSVDTSAEAIKTRLKIVGGDDDDADDDDDNGKDNPYSEIGRWAEEHRDTVSADDVYKRAVELGIEKKHRTVLVLVESLFTKDMVSEIPKFAENLFAKMIGSSEKHQKSLLGGLERFIGILHPELVPAVPKILMQFYQAGALEEEVLKQWGTHVSKKYVDKETSKMVRKSSEPFLKWLAEADEEDSDDDDE